LATAFLFFAIAIVAVWSGIAGVAVDSMHQTSDRPLEDFAIAVRSYSLGALGSLCGLAVLLRQIPFRASRASIRWRRAFLFAFIMVAAAWIVPPLLIDAQRPVIIRDPSYWVQVVVVVWSCGFCCSQAWTMKSTVQPREQMPTSNKRMNLTKPRAPW
jgi:hypothetical protein